MEVDGWDCSFPRDASRLEPSTNKEPLSESGEPGRGLTSGIIDTITGTQQPCGLVNIVIATLQMKKLCLGVMQWLAQGYAASRGRGGIWGALWGRGLTSCLLGSEEPGSGTPLSHLGGKRQVQIREWLWREADLRPGL